RPGATRTRCSASPTDRATGRRYGSSTGWGTRQCAGRSTRGGGWGSPARARAARCSACCATSCRARSCSCTSARRATAARSTRRRCRPSSGSCARAATGSSRWLGYERLEPWIVAERLEVRVIFDSPCAAPLLWIVEEDASSDRRIDLFAVDSEDGASHDHDVQLLVLPRTRARLVVLLDDEVARVRRVGVDPERLDPERAPQRAPLQFVADRDPGGLDLLDARDLHALALRSASSTIGSTRETPSTRSSRFAAPAQSSNACCRSPLCPSRARRSPS